MALAEGSTFITIALIAVYFVVLLGIGVWASKKIKNSEDYMLAGRSLGFWLFTLLIVCSICSGMTLVGTSGFGFASGWPGIWEQIFVPLSAAFCIIFFGSKLNKIGRKSGCMTIVDYFALRYENTRELRTLSAIASIAVSLVYLVGQYTAISIVLIWAFGLEHWQALLIAGVIITAYTVIGGLYAVSWTGLVQGLILIFGVILVAPFILTYAGGLEHINTVLATIDPNLVMPWFPSGSTEAYAYCTPEYLFSFGVLLIVGLACAPHVLSNVFAARKTSYFKWAPLVAFSIYLVIMLLIKICGMAVRSMQADGLLSGIVPEGGRVADFALMYGIQAASPSILITGLFAVIVLSAVMSTTDRLMLTVGTTFSWDIFKTMLKPMASERQVVLVSQICVLLAAVISLILAINPPEMLAFLIWLGIGLMLSAFAVPMIAGLYWRRATAAGAIASMLVGLITCLAFGAYYNFIDKLPMHFSIYSLLCSIAAMVIVSLLTKKNSEKALDLTYTGMYLHPKDEPHSSTEQSKE
ncbi:Na+/solute symporter [Methanocorpusculum labreanum Z]|uniref:Na+/solute symporter n=1 Tax=Methanocorpusculum labreanum (strain ATCC 43576 / DSM 4855 / Z) TaxID=410358 RepID=A2SRS9_METLZ|nr:sodium:solute symporter family protein [Methanocorpusculum labreanum]ABN07035.1 Na+/solute symporter [Methanocorpusculum labreanum Z]